VEAPPVGQVIAAEESPTLVAVTEEVVDEQTGEITEPQAQAQQPEKKRRGKAQAPTPSDGPPDHVLAPSNEDDFPDPPPARNMAAEAMRDNTPPSPPHPADDANNDEPTESEPTESEPMGDLF